MEKTKKAKRRMFAAVQIVCDREDLEDSEIKIVGVYPTKKRAQEELDRAAARSKEVPQLPNLLDLYYRKDLSSFAVALYSHEAGLIGFLLNRGIQFEQYANLERFEEAECSTVPKTAQAEQPDVD